MSFEILIDTSAIHPVIRLKDNVSGGEAEIYTFGGLLNAFTVPINGELINVVGGFESVDDAVQNITSGFKSAKLSPFVCRMNKGAYAFHHHPYQVQKHFLLGHAIHGLIYDAVYEITGHTADDSGAAVTLSHQYKGMDPGYPFAYHISITWELKRGNRLQVSTTMDHDHATAIPMADGWHPYFSIGGKVDEWILQFSASKQLEYDSELLPTGNKLMDERFLNGASLRDIVLDNGFEFDEVGNTNHCILRNDRIKLTIEPDNSYPVLQVYTPSHRESIAIENLSGAPDNFNNGMGLVLLAPGEKKVFRTCYTVEEVHS